MSRRASDHTTTHDTPRPREPHTTTHDPRAPTESQQHTPRQPHVLQGCSRFCGARGLDGRCRRRCCQDSVGRGVVRPSFARRNVATAWSVRVVSVATLGQLSLGWSHVNATPGRSVDSDSLSPSKNEFVFFVNLCFPFSYRLGFFHV